MYLSVGHIGADGGMICTVVLHEAAAQGAGEHEDLAGLAFVFALALGPWF